MSLDLAAQLRPRGCACALRDCAGLPGEQASTPSLLEGFRTCVVLGLSFFLFKRQKNDKVVHTTRFRSREQRGTVGLSRGQTTPGFGGRAHRSSSSRGACCPAPEPQSCHHGGPRWPLLRKALRGTGVWGLSGSSGQWVCCWAGGSGGATVAELGVVPPQVQLDIEGDSVQAGGWPGTLVPRP